MADIDMTKLVKLQALDALAQKADAKITAVETKADNAFKGAKVVNGNYTDATDPNLDGKAVLVLAIKTTDKGANSTSYSFIDINYLVDTYTAADNSITVSGYTIAVKISAAANNALELKADGLHVDISGKQDKDTDAVVNNVAKFDANGNAVDGGIAIGDVITIDDIASDSDVQTALSSYFVIS